jgi:hypothetical protein
MKDGQGKFDNFSKVFTKLNDKNQDSLVKTAYHLLKTHKAVKEVPVKPAVGWKQAKKKEGV